MKASIKPKIIFEIANNHQGSRAHFRVILEGLARVSKLYPFDFFIKFGYRDPDRFIHRDEAYIGSCDQTLVTRLRSAALSFFDYGEMCQEVRSAGFGAICTPFDEVSVEQVIRHGYDYLKIASASINDWPLLHAIAEHTMPIIASTGGISMTGLDEIVGFLDWKGSKLALMHCVSIYPTPLNALQLDRIDTLRARYPDKEIGYSTHVDPNDNLSTVMAISKGATWLERHVGVRTERYGLNDYSLDINQVGLWLQAVEGALAMCGEHAAYADAEKAKLHSLARGYFAKQLIRRSDRINLKDLYLSFPAKPNQYMAWHHPTIVNNELQALEDIGENMPILFGQVG